MTEFDVDSIPFNLAALMRRHRVTIRDLADRTGLTMGRIRELRALDRVPYLTYCDLTESITGDNVFDRDRHDRFLGVMA